MVSRGRRSTIGFDRYLPVGTRRRVTSAVVKCIREVQRNEGAEDRGNWTSFLLDYNDKRMR